MRVVSGNYMVYRRLNPFMWPHKLNRRWECKSVKPSRDGWRYLHDFRNSRSFCCALRIFVDGLGSYDCSGSGNEIFAIRSQNAIIHYGTEVVNR